MAKAPLNLPPLLVVPATGTVTPPACATTAAMGAKLVGRAAADTVKGMSANIRAAKNGAIIFCREIILSTSSLLVQSTSNEVGRGAPTHTIPRPMRAWQRGAWRGSSPNELEGIWDCGEGSAAGAP